MPLQMEVAGEVRCISGGSIEMTRTLKGDRIAYPEQRDNTICDSAGDDSGNLFTQL